MPTIPDIAGDSLSREHAKKSAADKAIRYFAGFLPTISAEEEPIRTGRPTFFRDRTLAYILLICVRNKSAALPCDPLRVECAEAAGFLFAAVLRRYTQFCDDRRRSRV
jgi:hypothetical protein